MRASPIAKPGHCQRWWGLRLYTCRGVRDPLRLLSQGYVCVLGQSLRPGGAARVVSYRMGGAYRAYGSGLDHVGLSFPIGGLTAPTHKASVNLINHVVVCLHLELVLQHVLLQQRCRRSKGNPCGRPRSSSFGAALTEPGAEPRGTPGNQLAREAVDGQGSSWQPAAVD